MDIQKSLLSKNGQDTLALKYYFPFVVALILYELL